MNTVNFYDWICPPYKCEVSGGGAKVRFLGQLPEERTKNIITADKVLLKILRRLSIDFSYTRIVADTNLEYIFQGFVIEQDTRRILNKLIENIAKIYGKKLPVVKIIKFSKLQKMFKKEYNVIYKKVMNERNDFIGMRGTLQYIAVSGNMCFNEIQSMIIAKRIKASYAAEGMVFSLLDKNAIFRNSVWMNNKEPAEMAAFTNLYRKVPQKIVQICPRSITEIDSKQLMKMIK